MWRFTIKEPIFSTPVVFRNSIFFGAHDSNLYCLDQSIGTILWKFNMKSQIYSSPSPLQLISGAICIVSTSSDGNLVLLDLNGKSLLRQDLFNMKDSCFSSPLVYRQTIYIGSRNNHVYSFQLI